MNDRIGRARSDTLAQSPRGEIRHWQIGPRIRVGGTIGKIGQDVKIGAGKALSNPIVDAALAMIPGVGPAISAAAGATGRVLDTSQGGLHGVNGVVELAKGGAQGYAAGKLGNAVSGAARTGGIKAVGSLAMKKALGTGGGAPLPGGGSESDPYGDGHPEIFDPSAVPGAHGGGWMDTVGSFLGNHGMDIAKGALGAGAAYEGYQNNKRSNQLTNDALSKLNANPQAPDLSPIFADQGNPYARNRKIPVVGRL